MQGLRLLIGVAIACLLLRTFVAVGLIEPVVVVGSSMAPRLVEGDHVVVDRASMTWRPVRRWERVVARVPEDARQLAIKRVLALPGERIEFRGGNVWIDGQLTKKLLAEQIDLRVLVHREASSDHRWLPEEGDCSIEDNQIVLDGTAGVASARYRHPDGGVLHDDLTINRTVTRRLNAIADLMIGCEVQLAEMATWRVDLTVGDQSLRLQFADEQWRLTLKQGEQRQIETGLLPQPSTDGFRNVLISRFDQQACVVVDEIQVFAADLPPLERPVTEPQQLEIRAHDGVAIVRNLALWRDVYYERRVIDRAGVDTTGGWRLGPDRWFLVGDNQAISLDSRSWRSGAAGVPGKLMLGRAHRGGWGRAAADAGFE